MKFKHLIYILGTAAILFVFQLHLNKHHNAKRSKVKVAIKKILGQLEVGDKINLFFITSFEERDKNSVLYKVDSKIGKDQFRILSKPLNEIDGQINKIPFGDLILLQFDNEQTIHEEVLFSSMIHTYQYINWSLPPQIRSRFRSMVIRSAQTKTFTDYFLNKKHGVTFLLISTLIILVLLIILNYFIKKINSRKFDILIYAVAIFFAFRVIHLISFSNIYLFAPQYFSSLPGPYSYIGFLFKVFKVEILFIIIPLFIGRYFIRSWKSKLSYLDQEIIKCLVLFGIGSLFIIVHVSIIDNTILRTLSISGIFPENSLLINNEDHPYYINIIPLLAIVLANFLHNIYNNLTILKEDKQALFQSKKKLITAEAKLNEIHSSINPHFLYNSFNSIAALAKKDPEKTEEMTLALSSFYKYTTNREGQTFSTVEEEIEMVKNYLEIEKVRFDDRLSFDITIEEGIGDKEIPYFILQPLIENAIKYGYNKQTDNIEIRIEVKSDSDNIRINIFDNGQNFDEELSKGYGLESVTKKLQLLYPNKHEISFNNDPKHVSITLNSKND